MKLFLFSFVNCQAIKIKVDFLRCRRTDLPMEALKVFDGLMELIHVDRNSPAKLK